MSLPNPGHDIEFLCKISDGRRCSVYRVYNPKYQLHFAAKVFPFPKSEEKDLAREYENEVHALRAMDHPNILRIYDFFKDNAAFYIVFEDCSGGNLQVVMDINGRINMPTLQVYCLQILQAVAKCHESNFAHCNINPSNILFDAHDRPKLCDFKAAVTPKNTIIQYCPQTDLNYTPPEVLAKKPYDPSKADIWSLGIVFYYMATGLFPWHGANAHELLTDIQNTPLMFPAEIPAELKVSLNNMLKVDPDKRHTPDHVIRDQFFLNATRVLTNATTTLRRLSKQPSFKLQSSVKGSITSDNRLKKKAGHSVSMVVKATKPVIE